MALGIETRQQDLDSDEGGNSLMFVWSTWVILHWNLDVPDEENVNNKHYDIAFENYNIAKKFTTLCESL